MDSIVEHEKIKVSVITPVYNCESLISECIESVLQQTHRNLEFIIIDDGSTDNTGRICDNYQLKDDRITVIHKRNEGQGVARNVGLDICSGDYISFVDGDDSILPEMIESLLNCIILNGSDMSMCGFLVYDGLRTQKCSSYKEEIHFTNLQLMKEYVSTNKISRVPWNKLYARYLFDGIRFPSLRAHEDAYIMHSILGKVNKLVIIPDCLYKQYIRKESTENSPFSIKKLAALDCSTSIMDYYRINYPQYYSFVAFYMVDSIVDLEKQIIYSFSYRRNKELYSFLQSKLQY